jgi:hypothetical protein
MPRFLAGITLAKHSSSQWEDVALKKRIFLTDLNRLILFVFPILLPLWKLTDGFFALDAIDHHNA